MKILEKDDSSYVIEFNKTSGDETVFIQAVKELRETVFKELLGPEEEEQEWFFII